MQGTTGERVASIGPWGRGEIQQVERFEALSPGAWQGLEPPRRDWMVEGAFLRGTVAMVSGDGGIGKSQLMQQLCTAAVLGREWLGMRCAPGRALYIACEDDRDELWRRQAAINRHLGCDMADIGDAGLCLAPRVGQDNAMIRLERASWTMKPTDLFRRVARYCREHGKQYVVLDTATQTFAGNQNDEMQVVSYIAELRRLAMAVEGVVILTKHPSMAGRALGTGESGNVAWNNSVRSRLYVMKDKQGFITLKTMKSNYAPSGGVVPLKWDRGVLGLDKPDQPPLSYGYDD